MRRVALGGVVVAMALGLTGCPVPPPGYQNPTLDSAEVSPQPVHPGETLTVVIEASDDQVVAGAATRFFYTPTGGRLDAGTGVCTSVRDPGTSATHVRITMTCPVPTFANDGTWNLEFYVNDNPPDWSTYGGLVARVPFEVTGGSNDVTGPELVSSRIDPPVVDQETTFTLTLRVRDETPPVLVNPAGTGTVAFAKLFANHSLFLCTGSIATPVSATDTDLVSTCSPYDYNAPGRAEPGTYRSVTVLRDALGQEGTVEIPLEVVAGP